MCSRATIYYAIVCDWRNKQQKKGAPCSSENFCQETRFIQIITTHVFTWGKAGFFYARCLHLHCKAIESNRKHNVPRIFSVMKSELLYVLFRNQHTEQEHEQTHSHTLYRNWVASLKCSEHTWLILLIYQAFPIYWPVIRFISEVFGLCTSNALRYNLQCSCLKYIISHTNIWRLFYTPHGPHESLTFVNIQL